MNATDRFCAVLRGQIPDRIPVITFAMEPHKVRTYVSLISDKPQNEKLQNTDPNIEAVLEKARDIATFTIGISHPSEIAFTGAQISINSYRKSFHDSDYFQWCSTWQTPLGELHTTRLISNKNLPAYIHEHLFKEPDDIKKLLSIPFEPFNITSDWVNQQKSQFDDRCLIIWNVGTSPAAMLYHYAGPENFSFWSLEHRDLLQQATEELAWRRLKMVDALAKACAGPVFTTNGYEDFIPPLQSPRNLREFVMPFEKQFCEKVHSHNCFVWSHSHGRVNAFLEDFLDIGCDCLQPLEPPPMGDVDFADAKKRIGKRITLVGNIQTHDLMTAPTDEIIKKVQECIRLGKPEGRFALSPSAEPIVTPTITDLHRDNMIAYFDTACELGGY